MPIIIIGKINGDMMNAFMTSLPGNLYLMTEKADRVPTIIEMTIVAQANSTLNLKPLKYSGFDIAFPNHFNVTDVGGKTNICCFG